MKPAVEELLSGRQGINRMRDNSIKVLLIEDNPADSRLIWEMLNEVKNVSFEAKCTERLSTGLGILVRE